MKIFSNQQMLILKVCGVIIAIGLIILGIDRFIVRRGEPSAEERLDALVEELDVVLREDAEAADQVRRLLAPFEEMAGNPTDIGPILYRQDEGGDLWVFEYRLRKMFLYRLGRPNVDVDVPLLGILMELPPSAALPAWRSTSGEPPPTPPFSAPALARLAAVEDLDLAMDGRVVFFTSRLETWALQQAMNQRISAEFHPGLLNSALRVDVQRAIDVVNLLETGLPAMARFYELDIPKPSIEVPSATGISATITRAAEELQIELDALRAQREEERAAREAAFQADMEAANQRRQEQMEARQAEMKANLEAARRQREQERAARMAEIEARRAERMAAYQAQLDAIEAGIPTPDIAPPGNSGEPASE